jgi:hypothetical protein
MGFGFIPISRQGWLAVITMFAVFLPCGYLWVNYIDRSPYVAWTGAVDGALASAAYHALVLWKLERSDHR